MDRIRIQGISCDRNWGDHTTRYEHSPVHSGSNPVKMKGESLSYKDKTRNHEKWRDVNRIQTSFRNKDTVVPMGIPHGNEVIKEISKYLSNDGSNNGSKIDIAKGSGPKLYPPSETGAAIKTADVWLIPTVHMKVIKLTPCISISYPRNGSLNLLIEHD